MFQKACGIKFRESLHLIANFFVTNNKAELIPINFFRINLTLLKLY